MELTLTVNAIVTQVTPGGGSLGECTNPVGTSLKNIIYPAMGQVPPE